MASNRLIRRRDAILRAIGFGSAVVLSVACSTKPPDPTPVALPSESVDASQGKPWWLRSPPRLAELTFVDVTVAPMDVERTLAHQTLLVRDGRISALGPRDAVPVPPAAVRIDGRGNFLVPGLADMHVHATDQAHGLLYLANGVTSVRNMWGWPSHLTATERADRGEWLGPTLYTTGPITDGSPPVWPNSIIVDTAEDAERVVDAQHQAGFRSVKVYNNLTFDAYRGIVGAARRLQMTVVGHVPTAVGLQAALLARQDSIEHLWGYLKELPFSDPRTLADHTRDAGVWNCPTLVLWHHSVFGPSADERVARPEMRYLAPPLIIEWLTRTRALPATTVEQLTAVVQALHDAGASLLLGTDAPNPWVVPGFSIHEELGHPLGPACHHSKPCELARATQHGSSGRSVNSVPSRLANALTCCYLTTTR
jgi:imidazolonepropionase-like amidohydrolase